MSVPEHVVKVAQHACQMEASEIDGIIGPKTLAAAREYDMECADFKAPRDQVSKLIIMVAQHACGLRGRSLDGLFGTETDGVTRTYVAKHNIALGSKPTPAPKSAWAVWQPCKDPKIFVKDGVDLLDGTIITPPGGLSSLPTKRQRDAVYGDAKALGEVGIRKHLTSIEALPGRFNTGQGVLHQVHKKVVPHIKLALELCRSFGVIDEIYKIWFFNYRHQRHDASLPLSLHSWGIACDINPRENFAWTPSSAEAKIHPFTSGWQKKYPRGLSQTLVLCMKKAGFVWGGDWPKFRDPMHFELLT
jgi:hypothetical protein